MKKPGNPQETSRLVEWFRQSSPYIHAFRGKLFVLAITGEAMETPRFSHLIQDIILLNGLGIKLVLVHGLRPQIDRRLKTMNAQSRFHHEIRITDDPALDAMKDALGSARIAIESLLSMGLSNTPLFRQEIKVISGNFITACPIGVIDGIDYLHTGKVRRIDHRAILQSLSDNSIVLLPPVGYSPTGETFNLMAHEIATAAAISLQAEKLIFLANPSRLRMGRKKLPRELTFTEAEAICRKTRALSRQSSPFRLSCLACGKGVRRCHILDQTVDGALLLELFTRDGHGTLISADHYEDIRHATIADVGGIMQLIAPLEEKKILVKRPRQLLETDIHHYVVVERDGMVIGCAALHPIADGNSGEIACLAVHDDYRNKGYGDKLLTYLIGLGKKAGMNEFFVLTTQAAHWFKERGFQEIDPGLLPVKRRLLYNYQRNSKILTRKFDPA